MREGFTVVVPGPGEQSAVAQLLLDLADHPRDVRSQSNGARFLVPSYLGARYERATAPAPKKRRPPKNTESEESS